MMEPATRFKDQHILYFSTHTVPLCLFRIATEAGPFVVSVTFMESASQTNSFTFLIHALINDSESHTEMGSASFLCDSTYESSGNPQEK